MPAIPILAAVVPSLVTLSLERCLVLPQFGNGVVRLGQLLLGLCAAHLINIPSASILRRPVLSVPVSERLPRLRHKLSHGFRVR